VVFPNTKVCRRYCDDIRALVREHGRSPQHIKILAGVVPIAGATEEEARRKYEWVRSFASPEGALALFGGWTGIDLSLYGPEDKIRQIESHQMQFLAQYFSSVDP
jgi:alkanesulfonate monooxygenase SsuD/methylene tetrahydromethanopterin reductase-like flavin-dependent oxidoreductase (luciferase family)